MVTKLTKKGSISRIKVTSDIFLIRGIFKTLKYSNVGRYLDTCQTYRKVFVKTFQAKQTCYSLMFQCFLKKSSQKFSLSNSVIALRNVIRKIFLTNIVYTIWNDFFGCFWKRPFSQSCFDIYQLSKTRSWKWQCYSKVAQRCSYQRWNAQHWFDVAWRCPTLQRLYQPLKFCWVNLKVCLSLWLSKFLVNLFF